MQAVLAREFPSQYGSNVELPLMRLEAEGNVGRVFSPCQLRSVQIDGKLLCFLRPGVCIMSNDEGSDAFLLSRSAFITSHSSRVNAGESTDKHRLIILPSKSVT